MPYATLLSVLGVVVAAGVGCNLIPGQTPTSPTPEASATPVAITIPVILGGAPTPAPGGTPTPAPGGTPTPTPTATPAPAPTPTPEPAPTGSCKLPPSNPPKESCGVESAEFLGQVDKAITRVTELHPELFNFKDNKCENCYLVKDWDRYNDEVVNELQRRGFCAQGGEELGVKNTNAYNEQYDILVSSGHIRRGAGSYRVTCRPAAF
jgi:hypothetical protein